MVTVEDPAADGAQQAVGPGESVPYTALSHPEMLEAGGLSGALFANWHQQKRRTALQQRYGEDFAGLADDASDARTWLDGI